MTKKCENCSSLVECMQLVKAKKILENVIHVTEYKISTVFIDVKCHHTLQILIIWLSTDEKSWIIFFLLLEAGLAPTAIFLNSTTNMFVVSWNNPTTHYELVSGYEVVWKYFRSLSTSSGLLEKNVNQYTVSNGLMSGQLYTVTVISHVTLTNPAVSTVVSSPDTIMRTGM